MSKKRDRNDRGQYTETITLEDVLAVMRQSSDPVVTAKAVGERLGCSSEAARQKLTRLTEAGRVERRKVGAGAVVWWLADQEAITTDVNSDDPFFTRRTYTAGEPSDTSERVDEILYGKSAE